MVICGPTAVGKTNLAIHLAGKLEGEIVSADSRQVYIGMDIGTGKDLPKSAIYSFPISNLKQKGIGCYEVKDIKLWGYDLVSPKKGFSVAEYSRTATVIVENIWERGKLPIIVGGSGLYIRGLVDGIETSHIPQDINLRLSLDKKGKDKLFEMLTRMDPVKAGGMNKSDRKNPRRLVRAIEVSMWKIKNKGTWDHAGLGDIADTLFIGLGLDRNKLNDRINNRVESRLKSGMLLEINKLINEGVGWDMQAMNTIGYKEWKQYFEKKLTKEELANKWKSEERKYAKRQMTWFKKDKRILWFDVGQDKIQKRVEKHIQQWYSSIGDYNAKKD